jgi:hypothetical protein
VTAAARAGSAAVAAVQARLPAALLGVYRRDYHKPVDGLRIPAVHQVEPVIYDLVERWYVCLGGVLALTAPRNCSLAEVQRDVHALLVAEGYRREPT